MALPLKIDKFPDISTKEKYDISLQTGDFWKYHYPKFTGDWNTDSKNIIKENKALNRALLNTKKLIK